MPTRTRSRTLRTGDGIQQIGSGPVTVRTSPRNHYFQQVTDYYGKFIDRRGYLPSTNCDMIWRKWEWTPISYSDPGAAGLRLLEGVCPSYMTTVPNIPDVTGVPNESSAVTTLLSRTNPFRSGVDLPVMMIELITMTSFLSKIKGSLINAAGDLWLRKSFEVDPYKSDIKTLENILKILESRIREYNSLFGKGGLHRTNVKIWSGQEVANDINLAFHSSPVPASRIGNRMKRQRVAWTGTVRWFPRYEELLPQPDPIVRTRAILQNIAGLNLKVQGIAELWELIPFSFLMDYFINLNEILGSAQGRQYVTPRYISVTKKTSEYALGIPHSGNAKTTGGFGKFTSERIQRYVFPDGYVGDVAVNSLLSAKQLANLTALVAVLQKRI